jgi:YhcH/YjgK/YiaL family protein
MKLNFCLSLVILLSATISSYSQVAGSHGNKEASKWFRKKEWLHGLNMQPYKGIDKQEFYRQYQKNKKYWDEAFEFLKNQDLQNLAVGKHVIDGDNVYALVTFDSTKNFERTRWESHKKYIDLQHVIGGKEKIGVAPVSTATISEPYSEQKDLMNYTANGKFYTATPSVFFVFFPTDAHRPGITPGGNLRDKKIVIKIRYAE